MRDHHSHELKAGGPVLIRGHIIRLLPAVGAIEIRIGRINRTLVIGSEAVEVDTLDPVEKEIHTQATV